MHFVNGAQPYGGVSPGGLTPPLRGGVRGAIESFAPAQPPPRAIALSSTGAQSTTSQCPHRSFLMVESLCRQTRAGSRRRKSLLDHHGVSNGTANGDQ
eukprot:5301018-Pleurochrysis_carterae.AAC.1